jgi:hypothetical protein
MACAWNLAQAPVRCVVPTLIEEVSGKPVERKVEELASIPDVTFSEEELRLIASTGDNTGCMVLKGANPGHLGDPEPDRWGLTPDLLQTAARWGIDPAADLVCRHG